MVTSSKLTRAEQVEVRAQLRILRTSITQARDLLVHFKDDRIDRDKLEPAARRVDDLMDMFVGERGDSTRGCLWLAQIQNGIDEATNPKASDALNEARAAVAELLKTIGPASARIMPVNSPY